MNTFFSTHSVHVSLVTALVSLTCTLSTHAQNHNSHSRNPSSRVKGQSSQHSVYTRLLNLSGHSIKDLDDLSSVQNLGNHKLNSINGFHSMQYNRDNLINKFENINSPDGTSSSSKSNNHMITNGRWKTTKPSVPDLDNTYRINPLYSIIINNLLSQKRHEKYYKIHKLLNHLTDMGQGVSNDDHPDNPKIPSSTSSEQPSFILSSSHHHSNYQASAIPLSYSRQIRQLRRHLLIQKLFSHQALLRDFPSYSDLSTDIPRANDEIHHTLSVAPSHKTHGAQHNNNRSHYNNNDNGVNYVLHYKHNNNNNDNNDNSYTANNVDNNDNNGGRGDHNKNQDGGTTSDAFSGNEDILRSAYNFPTPSKRGPKRTSRIMQYLRQRAGSVKARKPLRYAVKSSRLLSSSNPRLRQFDEEIVRRQPLRQPLTLYGHSKEYKHSCKPEVDGSQPMTCPSHKNVCLYDSMFCDGQSDCPDGADEEFTMCVLRHWSRKMLHKIEKLFEKIKTS